MGRPKKVKPPIDPSLNSFNEASLELEEDRHKNIGNLFDKAVEVLSNYLDDANSDLSAKMFPAKLAADIYMAQEKFKRDDERILIEKERLKLEESKNGILPANGNTTLIQNNFSGDVNIGDIKKKQEELLASFIKKPEEPKD